jgi:hypothetical protein
MGSQISVFADLAFLPAATWASALTVSTRISKGWRKMAVRSPSFSYRIRLPPCIRHRPFAIAGDWHGDAALVRARQRGVRCMGTCFCEGLFLDIAAIPAPRIVRAQPPFRTMSSPPAWTWTLSIATFCWPLRPHCPHRPLIPMAETSQRGGSGPSAIAIQWQRCANSGHSRPM